MSRPQQSISLSAATAQMRVMAGQYGRYPWSFSREQADYLRALSPMPDDLAEALKNYDEALEKWRDVERAMVAAPAGSEEEAR